MIQHRIPGQALLTASLGYKWSPTGACVADSGSGSETYAGADNPLVPVGVMQGVWAVDTKTGEILRDGERIPAQDGNEAFTVATREGYLLMDRGVMSSGLNSFFYPYIESKFPDDFKPLLPIGGVEILAGKDDILITGLGGKVWFYEAFEDGKSSLTLSEKGRKRLQLKGEARGKGDTVYKVSLKSGRHGWGVNGHIEVKQGRKTLHKIDVTHGSFNDRSAQGTGFDKRTVRTVKWSVSDWR